MMNNFDLISMCIAGGIPLVAALFSLVYGLKHFFKKGKPLFLQSITMAMGSHLLGSIYQICYTLTNENVMDGFTPAYLGRIGFFLFIVTASYGHMDRIVDDRSPKMRKSRIIALVAPVLAILLFIPNVIIDDVAVGTKISYALVWLPATVGVYFNLKHAIIPNADFNFIKAIRPYNFLMLALGFSELLCLTAWDYLYNIPMIITSAVFGALCICTMVAAKKGVEKWTI